MPPTSASSNDRPDTLHTLAPLGVALLAMSVAVLLTMPGIDGVRALIRCTARSSLLLFLAAFMASTLARELPGRVTRALLERRRGIGLAFACSHAVHAFAIAVFASTASESFLRVSGPPQWITGGIAYIGIIAMVVTSNDHAIRWLGAARWRTLHSAITWYLWVSFTVAFAKRIPLGVGYMAPVIVLLAAAAWKIVSSRRRIVTMSS